MQQLLLMLLLSVPIAPVQAAGIADANALPHVGQRARDTFAQMFITSDLHRAFAIAPGGAWGWGAGHDSAEAAGQAAMDACNKHTDQTCVLYALDHKVTFDREQWPTLWRPYSSADEAEQRASGLQRGERFPDLLFYDGDGKERFLSDLRGKIVLVHFWGSWCPPCLREFPSLDVLHRILKAKSGKPVEMVMLQVREYIDVSRAWAEANGFGGLPLYDSGVLGDTDLELTTRTGEAVPDRAISKVFPSSYVLDANGVVLFSHRGPIHDWTEYLKFFDDAAAHLQP